MQGKLERRIRYNGVLYHLYKSPNIINIEVSRLRWAWHVKRMDETELARRILAMKLERVRCRGILKLYWIDGMGENLSKLGIKG